ncbi:MAG: sigma-70 family RNA polymerase sigma factor [Planctomycetia bacterium]
MAFPTTDPGLLRQLKDPAETSAWDRFVAIYRPAIVAVARQRGLAFADADDVAQEVFTAVAGAVHRFDPDREDGARIAPRARFSTWLTTIAARKSIDVLRRRDRPLRFDPALPLAAVPTRATDSRLLRSEIRRRCFHAAAADVRGEVTELAWGAFWMTAIDGLAADAVARILATTPGAVYAAKARVMRRLVERIRAVEADWSLTDFSPEG